MKSLFPSTCILLAIFVFALSSSRSHAQSSTPPLGHVVVVAFENHSNGDVVGSSSMPYYNSLISQYGWLRISSPTFTVLSRIMPC